MKIDQRNLYKPEYSCNNAVWEQWFDCTFLKLFVLLFVSLKVHNLPKFSLFFKNWAKDGWILQILYHMIQELSKRKLFREIYISLSIPVITRFGNSNLIVQFWNFLFFLFLLWKFRIFQIFLFFFIWDTTHYDDTEWNTDNPTQNHPPLHTINLKMFLKQCHSGAIAFWWRQLAQQSRWPCYHARDQRRHQISRSVASTRPLDIVIGQVA